MQAESLATDLARDLLGNTAAALIGALVTALAFKARLDVMQTNIVHLVEQREADKKDAIARLDKMDTFLRDTNRNAERRQLAVLEIVANIAEKVGADHRITDTLNKFIHGDDH